MHLENDPATAIRGLDENDMLEEKIKEYIAAAFNNKRYKKLSDNDKNMSNSFYDP